MVECVRHEGGNCTRCDGSGLRPLKRCAECGVESGRPSEGGKALLGLKNERGGDRVMFCMICHPDHMGGFGAGALAGALAVAVFERMGA